MNKKTLDLNTILAVVLGIFLLAAVLVRVFMPIVILPKLDICNIVLVSLVALLAGYYLKADMEPHYGWLFGLAILTFGLLPWVSGFAQGAMIWKTGFVGGTTFTAVTWLFASMVERIQSGKSSKLTPVVCAFGIYLAAQCFAGMIL